jgi:2-hydroxy-3-keto-5-methylthiopentenyl-1-phosphate phosphatase
LEIRPYAALPIDERPTLLYAGDGISDLSAASETDLLFAKKGNGMSHLQACPASRADVSDLVNYCERQGMPFTVFEDWSSILDVTKDILSGNVSVKNVAQEQERTVHKGENKQ